MPAGQGRVLDLVPQELDGDVQDDGVLLDRGPADGDGHVLDDGMRCAHLLEAGTSGQDHFALGDVLEVVPVDGCRVPGDEQHRCVVLDALNQRGDGIGEGWAVRLRCDTEAA